MSEELKDVPMDKALLAKITEILNENDPYDIISVCTKNGFAYEDVAGEYETEARTILLREDEWESPWGLQNVIKDVFDQFFHYPNISEARYTQTARAIWNALLVHQGEEPVDFPDDIEPPQEGNYITLRIE